MLCTSYPYHTILYHTVSLHTTPHLTILCACVHIHFNGTHSMWTTRSVHPLSLPSPPSSNLLLLPIATPFLHQIDTQRRRNDRTAFSLSIFLSLCSSPRYFIASQTPPPHSNPCKMQPQMGRAVSYEFADRWLWSSASKHHLWFKRLVMLSNLIILQNTLQCYAI